MSFTCSWTVETMWDQMAKPERQRFASCLRIRAPEVLAEAAERKTDLCEFAQPGGSIKPGRFAGVGTAIGTCTSVRLL
jgi:hypothetical protein